MASSSMLVLVNSTPVPGSGEEKTFELMAHSQTESGIVSRLGAAGSTGAGLAGLEDKCLTHSRSPCAHAQANPTSRTAVKSISSTNATQPVPFLIHEA